MAKVFDHSDKCIYTTSFPEAYVVAPVRGVLILSICRDKNYK